MGSLGDSYDSALAETINGVFNAEASTDAGLGATLRASNMRPSNGSAGSIYAACSS